MNWKDEALDYLRHLCFIGEIATADKKMAMQDEIRAILMIGSESLVNIAKRLNVSSETTRFLIQSMGDVFYCEDSPYRVFLNEPEKRNSCASE